MIKSTTKHKISNKRLSFIISLVYVGIGTIYGITYWTEYNSTNAFSDFLFYFFMPTSFLLEVILFAERNPFLLGLLTQTITFFIFWGLFHFVLSLFRIDKLKLPVEK
jgi:hypothetical protein